MAVDDSGVASQKWHFASLVHLSFRATHRHCKNPTHATLRSMSSSSGLLMGMVKQGAANSSCQLLRGTRRERTEAPAGSMSPTRPTWKHRGEWLCRTAATCLVLPWDKGKGSGSAQGIPPQAYPTAKRLEAQVSLNL